MSGTEGSGSSGVVVGGGGGSGNDPAPVFGGLYGRGSAAAWIGGPPNESYTATTLLSQASPLAIRGLSPENEIKGHSKRVLDGCSTKFKRDDTTFNLLAFADEALSHMQTHGMDTVFYMKGVSAGCPEGEELFTYHSKYTKSYVAAFIAKKIADGVYDSYATDCLKESALWLVNSLDESLKNSLRPQLATRPTGPEVWMMIVGEVQADSLRRCAELAKKFKALTLMQFKGENVRDYAAAAENLLIQLERDDQLPNTHLLDIVDCFTACTVMEFQVHWMTRRHAIELFVMETLGKDKVAVSLMPNKIHFRDLLEEGKSKYNNLQHLWGTPNKPKEQALLGQVKALQAKLDKMDQQLKAAPTPVGGNRPAGRGNNNNNNNNNNRRSCWHCGGTDHIRRNCPNKDQPPANNQGGGAGNRNQTANKFPKPKPGEPLEKTVDGVKCYYCSKCRKGEGSWNKTHKTGEHKTKAERDAEKAAQDAPAPAANLASSDICQEIHSSWFE